MSKRSEFVRVAIALGSNLPSPDGSPEKTLRAALEALRALPNCRFERASSVWRTQPVGGVPQPDFFNAVVTLSTTLEARALLHELHAIEQVWGRVRATETRWGPRTLDLDIIFYGAQVIEEADFRVPHPRYAARAFVLFPLGEIAPDMTDPATGMSVESLLQSVSGHDGVVRVGPLFSRDDDESQESST